MRRVPSLRPITDNYTSQDNDWTQKQFLGSDTCKPPCFEVRSFDNVPYCVWRPHPHEGLVNCPYTSQNNAGAQKQSWFVK